MDTLHFGFIILATKENERPTLIAEWPLSLTTSDVQIMARACGKVTNYLWVGVEIFTVAVKITCTASMSVALSNTRMCLLHTGSNVIVT